MQGMPVDSDREHILELLPSGEKGMQLLADAPEELKADRDFMMEAVSKNGFALEFASEELRSDCDLVMTAMGWSDYSLKYASEELRADGEFMMRAVRKRGAETLWHASEELRSECEFIMTAVSIDWAALAFASEELGSDRDIVMAAVSSCGAALGFASEELRSDRNLVRTAVSKFWEALCYAPEELRSDSEILASTNFGSAPEALVLKATLLSGRSYTLVVEEGAPLAMIVRDCAENLGLQGTTAGVLITSDGTVLSSLEELQLGTLNEVTFVIP